jgi:hypothetical protein
MESAMFEGNSQSVLYRLRDLDRSFQDQDLRPYRPTQGRRLQSPIVIQLSAALAAILVGGAFFA